MSIKYTILENRLQPGTYYPRPVLGESVDLTHIAWRISKMTSFGEPVVVGVTMALFQEIVNSLREGQPVALGDIAQFSLRMSQVLSSPTDRFDPEAGGRLLVSASAKTHLTNAIRSSSTFERVHRAR